MQEPRSSKPTPALLAQRAKILLVDEPFCQPPGPRSRPGELGQETGPGIIRRGGAAFAPQSGISPSVLLDIQMHGLDGFETARIIRTRARSRHTPIISSPPTRARSSRSRRRMRWAPWTTSSSRWCRRSCGAKVVAFVELFGQKELARQQAEALRRLHQELEQRVQQRTAALAASNQALQRRSRAPTYRSGPCVNNEEQFRTLADTIPQLAWMTRPDGHIFWYKPTVVRLHRQRPAGRRKAGAGSRSTIPRAAAGDGQRGEPPSPARRRGRTHSPCAATTVRWLAPEPCLPLQ